MIYSETIETKTGQKIPLYSNGHPAHSKYNPSNEKLNLPEGFTGCVICAGIAGSFHIAGIINRPEITRIIAVEADEQSLEFAKSLESTKKIASISKIVMCSTNTLFQTIKQNYLPALHGNICFTSLFSWEKENPDLTKNIQDITRNALQEVSRDYSVQAHFGLLWQRNIFLNLRQLSTRETQPGNSFDTKLTAAVIAAGPTLDKGIERISRNRDKYFIISTDTAYQTLIKNKIYCNAVISVDSQRVSSEHFFGCPDSKNGRTHFVFDIASNPLAVKSVLEKGHEIEFVKSHHPLCELALGNSPLKTLSSGGGTVTIACCDWARLSGFSSIELFGADFSYSEGKPYASGTYLDNKFNSNSSRTDSSEKTFAGLMFRTELISKGNNVYSTQILDYYRKTLEQWQNEHSYERKGQILTSKITLQNAKTPAFEFDFDGFVSNWIHMGNLIDDDEESEDSIKIKTALLPYIAWLKKNSKKQLSLKEYFKLAFNSSLRYTK